MAPSQSPLAQNFNQTKNRFYTRPTDALRKDAYVSAHLPLQKEDQCPEDVFNRILWHATKGSQTSYLSWAVKVVRDDDD